MEQDDIVVTAEALITVTQTIVQPATDKGPFRQGLPSYTFQKAPGELWRARYDAEQNVVVIAGIWSLRNPLPRSGYSH